MRVRPLVTLTLVLAFGPACGCGAIAYRSTRLQAAPRDFDVVAVYPVELQFRHRYHDAYRKTDNLLHALRARIGDIPVIGPEEFTVNDHHAAPRAGSTLARDAAALGFAPARVAVLRAHASREEHNERKLVRDFHERPVGYLHLWYAIYRVRLELVTLDGEVLARSVGEAWEQRGDLAAAPAEELYPKLGEVLPRMLQDLYATAAPVVRLPRLPVRTDVEVVDTHRRLLRHPEVASDLRGAGGVERDVAELVHLSHLQPRLPAAWLPALRGADAGVVVVAARGAAARSGLRPGDVITAADGVPVRGPAAFARAVARGAQTLTVRRGAAPLTLALAAPCSAPRLAVARGDVGASAAR